MEKKMLLVDAYAQIFRGFYALPLMTNSKGEYTNAIFAFSRFLLQMEKAESATYGAVVFDLGRCVKRLEILPEYKANRSPTPEELKAQVPGIREMIAAFGFPILESEGIEADDLIAVLAANFADFKVGVVSADKDLAQMIDERVEMLIPQGKGKGFAKMGVAEVVAKFAVRPDQIVDYLSLIGDSSDNIPGVPGVGPKTAAKLLAAHNSIDEMLSNTDAIANEKLRAKIADASEILRKNIKLIKLDTTSPDDSWHLVDKITRAEPDWNKIAKLADDYELKGFKKDFDAFMEARNESTTGTSEPDQNKDDEHAMLQDDLFASPSAKPAVVEEGKKQETREKYFTPDLFG